jgi:dienelactone hydrolase
MTTAQRTPEGLPVIAVKPEGAPRGLFIHLPSFNQTKEEVLPILERLADKGYVAVSMDALQHGERGHEDRRQRFLRVFGNFRRYMWPILGQTALDVSRLTDWALAEFQLDTPVLISGLSMGGDIAVSAAGLDVRIAAVIAIGSTPDWKRPGMHSLTEADTLYPPGQADLYAQFFYDQLDPLTHPHHYARAPDLHFICGADDKHIPPDGALRFKAALSTLTPEAGQRVGLTLLPDLDHGDVCNPDIWWPIASDLIDRLLRSETR